LKEQDYSDKRTYNLTLDILYIEKFSHLESCEIGFLTKT